jgi:translation initiation factor 1
MKPKKVNPFGGLVYSTDPAFNINTENTEEQETLPPAKQQLTVRLDTKQRAGKAVTLLQGFAGTDADREQLGKSLKTFCGTGGSVKDGDIIVQGDSRERVMQWLQKNGYTAARKI